MMEITTGQSSNEDFLKYCKEIGDRVRLNKRILLVKGPQLNLSSFERDVAMNRCYYAYPPTGLQYLAASIGNRGLETRILDLNFEFLRKIREDKDFNIHDWMDLLEDYLEENHPGIIGVSNHFSIDTPGFISILEHLKKKRGDYIVIAGGQNATYEGEKLLERDLCDFVCEREGENKFRFLIDSLHGKKQEEFVPDILFKYGSRIERTTGERDVVRLKGNLIEAHKLVRIEDYCKVGTLSPYSRMSGKDKPFATILLNRGCEGGCKFCGVVDYMGRGIRSREIKDVLDEIEYLYKERGVQHFEWLDDDFVRYNSRAMELLQGIIDRGINISWASNNGFIARTLNEEILRKMSESGCLGFKIGVESGDAEILKNIRKPGNLESFMRFSELASKFPEMFIADNYIFGFPNETFGQILKSFNFSLRMNLDWSSYAIYQHNVSYFGDSEERKKGQGNTIGDFIPTKDEFRGKIKSSEEVYEGDRIFEIPHDSIPSREQLNHIWFGFNLVRNFIRNKNLTDNGRPEKFIAWTEAVQERYPSHPYINMFLALAHQLKDNNRKAEEYIQITRENLQDQYWEDKMGRYGLLGIAASFPRNREEAREVLSFLRRKYETI